MEFDYKKTVQCTAYLLIAIAVTQAAYTALYVAIGAANVPRQFLWGMEALLFTVLAAFAGAALVQAKKHHVAWSAIAFSAVLNVVQVCVGLTMFGPFREVVSQMETLSPLAVSVVAFSFMVYYAAKLLLGFAALIVGMAKMADGSKSFGGATAVFGAIAMGANAVLIGFGRDGFLPSPVAGGSGVIATLLLGFCLLSMRNDD